MIASLGTVNGVKVVSVPYDLLFVESGKQRMQNKKRIERIAKAWDWQAFGCLAVQKAKGKYRVIDGQHRFEAYKIKFPNGKHNLLCFISKGKAGEAFLRINGEQRTPSKNDIFKVREADGSNPERQIKKILRDFGIEIVYKGRLWPGYTNSPSAFLEVYRAAGGRHFRRVVDILTKSFMSDDHPETTSMQSRFLHGYAQFLKSTPNTLGEIEVALGKSKLTATKIKERAESKTSNGYNQQHLIAKSLQRIVSRTKL